MSDKSSAEPNEGGEQTPQNYLQLPTLQKLQMIDLTDVPDNALNCLGLRALGFSIRKIARITGLAKSTVETHLGIYDPQGICKVSQEEKRLITTEMLTSVGLNALLEITEEKLEVSDAKELAGIATKCVGLAERIRALDKGLHQRKTDLDNAIDYLDQLDHAEEAE